MDMSQSPFPTNVQKKYGHVKRQRLMSKLQDCYEYYCCYYLCKLILNDISTEMWGKKVLS